MLTDKNVIGESDGRCAVHVSLVGEGCTLQAAPWVEVVLERPQEVQERSKKVRAGTAKFIRWTGTGRSVYR